MDRPNDTRKAFDIDVLGELMENSTRQTKERYESIRELYLQVKDLEFHVDVDIPKFSTYPYDDAIAEIKQGLVELAAVVITQD